MRAQNISFKGCMPMEFYAKYERTGAYVPVVKPENVRRCQNFVVRNLNDTAGTNKSDEFVHEYAKVDADYRQRRSARSVHDKRAPIIKSIHEKLPFYAYLITGDDVDDIDLLGRQLGYDKKDIFERTGLINNSEVKSANKNYRNGIRNIIEKISHRIKDENGNKLVMQVYFTPVHNRKGELVKFKYDKVNFYPQEEI